MKESKQKRSFFLSRGAAGALDLALIVIIILFYSPSNVFSMKRALDNNSKGQAKIRNECENEEVINLHREIEDLQRLISRVKGDWLDGLGLKELQQLEQKLESGLTRVRSEKEIKLREENNNFRRQIKELCSKALQDPESSECMTNLEALHAYLEESSDSDTSLQLGL